jgi:hypothetical protein
VRVDHAAHHEGVICAVSQPETAMHLNAKYHLQRELRRAENLLVTQRCAGMEFEGQYLPCPDDAKRKLIFSVGWENVEVEWSIGRFRADVALRRGEETIAVIEVLVSHPSEPQKIGYLNRERIPWIEIRVTPEFYAGGNPWTADKALDTERQSKGHHGPWQCSFCAGMVKKSEEQREARQRQEAERTQRIAFARQFETKFIRLIDFYYPSGKKYRSLYEIQDRYKDEQIIYSQLQEVGSSRQNIKTQSPPISDATYDQLKQALQIHLADLKKFYPHWLIDASRDWMIAPQRFHPKMFMDPERFPYNYEFSNGRWRRVEPVKSRQGRPYPSHHELPLGNLSDPIQGAGIGNAISFLDEKLTCVKCGTVTDNWVTRVSGLDKTCICRECADKA